VTDRRVRELAEELGRRLRAEAALDPDAKAALADLQRRVEHALAGGQPGDGETEPSQHARGVVERFEMKHPELTAFVQRLADALMNAGL